MRMTRRAFAAGSLVSLSVSAGSANAGASGEALDGNSSREMPFAEVLQRSEKAFSRATKKGLPGAVVSVAFPSKRPVSIAYGLANADTEEAMQTGMWLRLGSISKLFVGHIALRLSDDGILDLDAPVSTFRDDVPHGDMIAVRRLGNHTSGIYNPIESSDFRAVINRQPDRTISRDEMLAVAWSNAKPASAIGTFSYSNANTSLLADIVEKATKKSISTLIREFFDGESESSIVRFPAGALPQNSSRGYRFGPNPPGVEYGKHFFDATAFSPSWADAAGDLSGRASDVLIAAQKIIQGEGLSQSAKALQRDFISVSDDFDYGFCLARYRGVLGHAGDVPGFSGFVGMRPEDGLSVCILTNLSNFAGGSSPASQMAADIFGDVAKAN
ncbi:MAG: serine hydrolase [Pseudomonadota bacterium]